MKQSRRKQIALDTLEVIDRGFYLNDEKQQVSIDQQMKYALDHTRLFTPEELDSLFTEMKTGPSFATAYEVVNETTLDAARRLVRENENNPACLNFASAKNPGGGFLRGSLAQEECIARASGLYPCLLKGKEYYIWHRSLDTCLYSDHMIYSPFVPVIKDEDGEFLNVPVPVTIITSPAVNAGVIRRNEQQRIDQIVPVMQVRIEKLLALCLHYSHESIVLGAWGCGVFQNDPEMIAQLFKDALEGVFKNRFKRVVFAIKTRDENMIAAFSKRFTTNDH